MNPTAALGAEPNASLPQPPGANSSAREDPRGPAHTATLVSCTFLLAVIFCLGSYGNFIVFLSFFDPAFRKFRTNFDFMILNLSFCDLFICGVTAPMFTFVLLFSSAGGVPDAFCFALHLTSAGFVLLSLETVAAIALHRLGMVRGQRPERAASRPCALLLSLLLWATSFTLATLATLATLRARRSPLCLPLSSLTAGRGRLALWLYVADFALCIAVVAVSYAVIARTLCRNAQVRGCPRAPRPLPFAGAPRRPPGEPAPPRGQAHPRRPGAPRPPAPAVRLSAAKDSRAVATCAVIVLSVLVCCLPLGVSLLRAVLSADRGRILCPSELLGFTLAFLKSGLNPFIYSRSSAGLRRRALCCLRGLGLGLPSCPHRHRTPLRAVGKGSLEVNRNKSSHHDTNSAYVLSPKPQKQPAERARGPGHPRADAASPRASAGPRGAHSSPTPGPRARAPRDPAP